MAEIFSQLETISFGASGNAKKYLGQGWDAAPVTDGTWTVAPVAQLAFQMAPSIGQLSLEIDAGPFVRLPALKKQTLTAYLNGIWIGHIEATNFAKLVFSFNSDILRNRGENVLSFVLPDATTASEAGSGSGTRPFGFFFRSNKIVPVSSHMRTISAPVRVAR